MDIRTVFIITFACFVRRFPAQTSVKEVHIPGDFVLGALFPIHDSKDGKCTPQVNEQDGIQILEATIFALREVNASLTHKGFTLGLIARDSCYDTGIALQHALEFAQKRYNSQSNRFENCTCSWTDTRNIIGVIGPPRSKETVDVANLLTLFKVPQISYFATTPELSDNVKYKYFKRTVPSDTFQAKALVSILRFLDWQYVSILYEDSNYGIEGYTEIIAAAEDAGICFGFDKKVKESTKEDELEKVVVDLMKKKNTNGKVVAILFMQYALAYRIMEMVDQSHNSSDVIWVGGDAWIGREPPSGQKKIIERAIGISPETRSYPGFAEYFRKINISRSPNPWFGEYLKQRYSCSLTDKKNSCTDIEIKDFRELLTAYNVRNAVYSFGSALDNIHTLLCGEKKGVCKRMKSNLTGELILQYLSNVSNPFSTSFHFENGRDGPIRYSVLQYKRQQNDYTWIEKGNYSGQELIWKTMNRSKYTASVCSVPCKNGQFRSRGEVCCWECKDCDYTEIVNASDPFNCQTCDIYSGWTSNPSQNVCVAIPVDHLHYNNPSILVIFVLSSLGIIICCVVSVVFILKRTTPIVKATGFETSIVLLVAILFSYISPFILVSEPTVASCAFFRVFLGLSYTMAYSSIFSKLMVYNRAFDVQSSIKNKSIQGQTVFNRNICTMKTALVISLTLSGLHFLALVFWSIGDTPLPVVKYSVTREEALGNLSCADLDNFSYFVSLAFSFLLMIACLVFAIKTRKLPDGMNDSHEIMYCSFTSFVLWIAFIPLYTFSENKLVKVMSLSISLIIHGTACLLCLFITKIYIVIFRPEKNNKERVMRTTPSRSRDSYSGSFQGSRAFEKRQSFGVTLEEKTSTNCTRKLSSACVADDTEEEGEDYSATTGTLPFKNSIIIDRSEKYSEEAEIVVNSLNRNSGEKLLGNKEDLDNIKADERLTNHKANGDILQNKNAFDEDERTAEHQNQGNFIKSIGFKPSSFFKRITSHKSQKAHVSHENIIEKGNENSASEKTVRRLSQSLPDVHFKNT
ncbi:metabotropic glutamate receptor 8-like [Saccostrea echinata]|uniref:metabotropic glutamate receptor 8-like n=1 Tax=Saccostrea echinata TaxID=191078 RepID=UPI002A837C20|nr:metabotropic glutamate receptor 8-like [Saccostrea echinata]XP_061183432.1 metabotropic glutamate receptor 8-like [Saccostrea echinata]